MMKNKAREWIRNDPNRYTHKDIEKHEDSDEEFWKPLSFGTSGLRAEMGPGPSKMNDLVVIQAAQGLSQYLQQVVPKQELLNRGVAIGFDHRASKEYALSSRGFAYLTAFVFSKSGIPVFLMDAFVATPILAFAVKRHSHAAGVMVTASHNPKQDNGYKVYWGNGCQIIPPHDEKIHASIQANSTPWFLPCPSGQDLCNDSKSFISSLLKTKHTLEQVCDDYYNELKQSLKFLPSSSSSSSSKVKFCYTAMHGVGYPFAKRAMDMFGFKEMTPVQEQIVPDPEFPTVEFPNPEEGKSALNLAFKTAEKNGCTIILANDPDADRLAVAEKHGNSWKVFNGNEIGALLGYWMLKNYKKKSSSGLGPAFIATTVSSKFLKALAMKENAKFEETLTGFKWISNKSLELREQGYDVIFSFEEAIGFCCGDLVLDKDGISAAVCFAELVTFLSETRDGMTCQDLLLELGSMYGNFKSNNGYVVCNDQVKKAAVFDTLRYQLRYPLLLGEGKYQVTGIRDLFPPGIDTENKHSTLPISKSNKLMLTLYLKGANNATCTIRSSGTEPKVKWYVEMSGEKNEDDILKDLEEFVNIAVKNDLLSIITQTRNGNVVKKSKSNL